MKTRYIVLLALSAHIFCAPPTEGEIVELPPGSFSPGIASSNAQYSALANSMVAWGLTFAAVISALTLIIDPSTADSSTSHSH